MSTRRPLPRGTLSQDGIVAAALALIDTDGLEALTMRRLAAALGAEAMSLYKHVPDKQALVDLVVELVLSELVLPDPAAPWDERLRFIAGELRTLACAHPHVFALVAVRLPTSPVALAPVEATLDALCDAGLDDEAVIAAFWAVVAYTSGALVAEAAALTGVEQPFPVRSADADLSALPQVSRFATRLANCDYRTEYERGLDLLIGAITAA